MITIILTRDPSSSLLFLTKSTLELTKLLSLDNESHESS